MSDSDNSTELTLKDYAALIKKREDLRATAERLKQGTKNAWRKFYDCEREISKANKILGIDRIFVEEHFNIPDAPVKKEKKRKLDDPTPDATQLKFD